MAITAGLLPAALVSLTVLSLLETHCMITSWALTRSVSIFNGADEWLGCCMMCAIFIGLAASPEVGRLIGDLLYEIRRSDPAVFVAVAAVLPGMFVFAYLVPVKPASRLDPIQAPQTE
jgi:hypothetical protein